MCAYVCVCVCVRACMSVCVCMCVCALMHIISRGRVPPGILCVSDSNMGTLTEHNEHDTSTVSHDQDNRIEVLILDQRGAVSFCTAQVRTREGWAEPSSGVPGCGGAEM